MEADQRNSGRRDLAARLAETAFRMRAYRLQILLEQRANFNPNQPRVPRGYRHGGRWTKPGGDWGAPAEQDRPQVILVSHEDEPPNVPSRRPATARERNRIGRAVARYLRRLPSSQRAIFLARMGWLANESGRTILSYFDEPKPLGELRRNAYRPRPGYDNHHIVEKTPARREGFPEWQIESSENRALIPRYRHWEITGWYGTKNEEFGGLSPREYLRGKSWEERYRVGLDALVKHGVLKR